MKRRFDSSHGSVLTYIYIYHQSCEYILKELKMLDTAQCKKTGMRVGILYFLFLSFSPICAFYFSKSPESDEWVAWEIQR